MLNETINRDPEPQQDWTLRQWVEAADGRVKPTGIVQNLIDTFEDLIHELGLDKAKYGEGWSKPNLNRWLGGRPMDKRHQAILMIAVLRRIAEGHRVKLFDDPNFATHVMLFLESRTIFEHAPTYLTPEDEGMFFRQATRNTRQDDRDGLNRFGLIHKVFPPPPSKESFIGRAEYIDQTLRELHRDGSDIVEITGMGGNGKTTVAWYIANEALTGNFLDFDWNTDKSAFLDENGQLRKTNMRPLQFVDILRSMARQFGWYDSAHTPDPDRLEVLCAEELRKASYLIVIDNAETIPADEWEIIRQRLRQLLQPNAHRYASSRSRVLVTTRYNTLGQDESILQGLTLQETSKLVQKLQSRMDLRRLLDHSDIERIYVATLGNPLMIKLILTGYAISPNNAISQINRLVQEIRDSPQTENKGLSFIIGGLFDQLPEVSQQLALAMIGQSPTWSLIADWARQIGYEGDVTEIIAPLLRHNLWHQVPYAGTQQEYTIHPLILAYLNKRKARSANGS